MAACQIERLLPTGCASENGKGAEGFKSAKTYRDAIEGPDLGNYIFDGK